MSSNLPVPALTGEVLDPPAAALPVPAQADSGLIALWVARSASSHTRRNYARQAARFLAFANRPLALVRLGDVQAYLDSLQAAAPATRANATAALKSLFSFAQEIGYLRFNLGKAAWCRDQGCGRTDPSPNMFRRCGRSSGVPGPACG